MRQTSANLRASHFKIVLFSTLTACMMFIFCFAIVPFYSLICSATGLSTSTNFKKKPDLNSLNFTAASASSKERKVRVQFIAIKHNAMPWDFYPKQNSVELSLGEKKTVYFYAKNTTAKNMVVQAIPSLTPVRAVNHFHKIECFCFQQQTLNAAQSREMALVFYVDKQLPQEIAVISLAYTLFDTTP